MKEKDGVSMDNKEQISAKRLLAILEDIQGGVVLCNYDSTAKTVEVTYTNRGWTDISGYTMEQLKAEKYGNPLELIFPDERAANMAEFARQLANGNTYEMLFRIIQRNGAICWIIAKGIMKPLADGKKQIQSIITDVTEIKEREERMTQLAQTDQLTGVHNKATFTLLSQAVLNRRGGCKCALLMLDIDSFKCINDTFGHDFGDRVLFAIAGKLKISFRSGDIIGRVGGDEFMVLMTGVSSEAAAARKAREVCDAIRSIQIAEHAHSQITVSVGISCFMDGKPFETMFAEADAALYCAKGNGKDQCAIAGAQPAKMAESTCK